MRILAIDYGTRRMGIALSDELQAIASPLEYIPAEPHDALLTRLGDLVRARDVGLILVGMPRNMDGSFGPAAENVRTFVAQLSASVSVPIQTWDERLTTVMANRSLIEGGVRRSDRKQKVDKMAAAILLQSYLDSREGRSTA